jgi:hypothetical protein
MREDDCPPELLDGPPYLMDGEYDEDDEEEEGIFPDTR